MSQLLRARWIFPVSSLPIEDGVIEIDRGQIVRIGSGPRPDAVDLGDVGIIPGLVNVHTHLEFSDCERPLAPAVPFADWVRSVVARRRSRAVAVESIIAQGLAEASAGGTTLLGEIATSRASTACLDSATIRSVCFWEVLGLDDANIQQQQAAVTTHLNASGGDGRPPSVRGLSPHAPYSLHPDLFRWTIETAKDRDVVVAMHLAETPEELQLLRHGTGPLVDLLRSWGLWRDGLFAKGSSVLDYLERLAVLRRVLVVHGNYLTDDEIDFLADRPQFSVAYCPRTHAYFGHAEHPWRTLLDRGVNIALGTDSRASNPDLSLWNELLFLRRQAPDIPAATLLRMATHNGAVALGCEDSAGTLAPRRPADLAVVAFGTETSPTAFPNDRLLHPHSRIVRTMSAGRWLP